MGTQLRVDAEELRLLLRQFQEKSGQMDTVVPATHTDMFTLTAEWKGDAASAYTVRMEEWCQQYQRVVNALHYLESALQGAINRLVQAEVEAQSLATRT
jgi:WXG100 family type VII secretion target